MILHAQEPLFLLNGERKILFVNRAWEQLTGHSAAEVTNLTCGQVTPTTPGDLESLGGSFSPPAEALEGQACVTSTRIWRADGEPSDHRLEFRPLHDEQGRLFLLGQIMPADAAGRASTATSPSHELHRELVALRDRLLETPGTEALVGQGPAHRRLLGQVAAAAGSKVPVLILGEPGTGKRTVALAIHQAGNRPRSRFKALDCQALPPELLRRGLFESAPGVDPQGSPDTNAEPGRTVLLREVLDLPRDLQELLAANEDPDVRWIGTSTSDPEYLLRADRLRPDFYFAFTTFVIALAPLRERLEELPLLAQGFLERANRRGAAQRSAFRQESLDALRSYDWPGNLTELARVVEAAHTRGSSNFVEVGDLPASIRGNLGAAYTPPVSASGETLDQLLNRLERRLIELSLQEARHNKSKAADALGISRPRLYRRIKELNIPDESDSDDEPPPA